VSLIDASIRKPVAVCVGVILVVMFGVLALRTIPIQLTPRVDRPRITVETRWPGAGPQEVEREIVQEQEAQLRNVEGLIRMTSECEHGSGRVILEFPVGTDVHLAISKVSNRLQQVQSYPQNVLEPVIRTADVRADSIAWFRLMGRPGNPRPVEEYRDFAMEEIVPRLERVEGVAASNVFGGRELELQVVADLQALSARGVSLEEVARALDRENRDTAGGDYDEGKRRYVVRTLGLYRSPEEVADVVVAARDGRRVRVGDVAQVRFGHKKATAAVRNVGVPALTINAQRVPGTNVMEVMQRVRETVKDLNENLLAREGLELRQVFDETTYIEEAIGLVNVNIVIGSLLATVVMFLFLRNPGSVLVVAVSIPISVVGTILVMYVTGRSINVVSLAGLSFAVGMLVDNSIVVLENIYRHRQEGAGPMEAARAATRQVWGAVLANTLTTLAVFIPVLYVQQEAGQIFRDIAVAISASVGLSLIVSITVVPMAAARMLRKVEPAASERAGFIASAVDRLFGRTPARLAVVLGLTAASVLVGWALAPKAEYLPTGNRNLVITMLQPPQGYNLAELSGIAERIERELEPHLMEYQGKVRPNPREPVIENLFVMASSRQIMIGTMAHDSERARDLIPILRAPLTRIPGAIGVVSQTSLFSREVGQGRSIDVEFTGPEIEQLVAIAGQAHGVLTREMADAQIRPIPSLDLASPEIHVIPDRIRSADLALDADQLGRAVDILLDGRKVSEYEHEGRKIDLTLRGPDDGQVRSQELENLVLAADGGRQATLGSVARVEAGSGPEQIYRSERRRAITLRVIPPAGTPLGEAIDRIEALVPDPPAPYRRELRGSADDLRQTLAAMGWVFVLAIVVTYLLMAALFEHFFYPLVVMFSVPLAAGGSFVALWLANRFLAPTPLDVVTMLGFVILVGTVVNNAILIVHQALNGLRAGASPRDAIRESVRTRVRPIFMSTVTSVVGMLPLVLMPGSGSELYRGLGAVVVGGLMASTIFTLLVVPLLFGLALDLGRRLRRA
jgi:HAE1 family hydrophobic/amphiphilic exporter-1